MSGAKRRTRRAPRPTLVDVFCGPGGLSCGFGWAGFQSLLAIDKIPDCTDTYAHNHPGTAVLTADLTDLDEAEVRRALHERHGVETVDVVAGGPPCESFSTAGPGIRKAGDHRDTYFRHVLRLARALRARYLLIENIPGLRSKKCKDGHSAGIFQQLLDDLHAFGYTRHDCRVLNAVDYGVPQQRQRLFVLATSDPHLPLFFPRPTHANRADHRERGWPRVTVEAALSDLPSLTSRQRDSDRATHYAHEPTNNFQRLMRGVPSDEYPVPVEYLRSADELTYHWAPNHRPATLERLQMIRQGEGLRDLWMRTDPQERERLQARRVLPARWYIQRFRRLVPTEPSVTVTSHCLDELAHPFDNRLVTVREAARLQGFPDAFQFTGGKWINPHGFEPQDKYEQVGDAVPPLLAWNLARCLRLGLGYAPLTADDGFSRLSEDRIGTLRNYEVAECHAI